jgi:hypothetical protein
VISRLPTRHCRFGYEFASRAERALGAYAHPHAESARPTGQDNPLLLSNSVRPLDNKLLASLPRDHFELLAPLLTTVSLGRGIVLAEPGDEFDHVYFPHSGMLSLLAVMKDGKANGTALRSQRLPHDWPPDALQGSRCNPVSRSAAWKIAKRSLGVWLAAKHALPGGLLGGAEVVRRMASRDFRGSHDQVQIEAKGCGPLRLKRNGPSAGCVLRPYYSGCLRAAMAPVATS